MSIEEEKNYYIKNMPRMMEQFDEYSQMAKDVLIKYFDDSKAKELVAKAQKEYEKLIPQLPFIGGAKNVMTSFLNNSILALAIMRALEERGLEFREIGKLSYDIVEHQSTIEAQEGAGDQIFQEGYLNILKHVAKESQLRRYPGDWVIEFVEGDGATFDYGYDITECGIYKLFKELGAEHFVPFICLSDYATARASGYGLKRTQILSNGAPVCDFRFSKGGDTPRGWPPEKLEDYKNK